MVKTAGHRVLLVAAAITIAGLAAAIVFLPSAAMSAACGLPNWLLQSLSTRLSITCLTVTFTSSIFLALIFSYLLAAGKRFRPARRGEQGAAVLEFALALPVAVMLVLLMIQSSLLLAGNVTVHYAANCAARAAVITLPQIFHSESRNYIGRSWDEVSAKRNRIKLSAVWAVLPVSSNSQNITPSPAAQNLVAGIKSFFSQYARSAPGWADSNYLGRKLEYAQKYTDVEIAPPISGYGSPYGDHEDLNVTVTHVLYLPIPYANRLFCMMDRSHAVRLEFGSGEYGITIVAKSVLPNEGAQDYIDVERFP